MQALYLAWAFLALVCLVILLGLVTLRRSSPLSYAKTRLPDKLSAADQLTLAFSRDDGLSLWLTGGCGTKQRCTLRARNTTARAMTLGALEVRSAIGEWHVETLFINDSVIARPRCPVQYLDGAEFGIVLQPDDVLTASVRRGSK